MADESKPAGNADRRPRPLGDGVGAAMIERPAGRVDVLDPDPLDPEQRATPLAEEQVIEGRERRIIVALGGLVRWLS